MAATSVLAIAIALASSWFADGVVSDLHRDGTGPLLLVRPLPRMALFLSRWLSGFVALAMTCLLCSLLLNLAWQLAGGQGRIVSDTGAVAAAAVAWIWVGSCVLLLSTVLERGEAIIGALLFLLPLSLAAIVTPGSALSAALAALPSKAVLYAARALLSGGATEAVEIASCVVWGAMVLAIGTLAACRREWRTTA
jgi:ABC-type transport system involved in multi-copper enzyme maturation permease subunit